MTRTLRTSFITIASATTLAGFALFSQGASATPTRTQCSATSQAEMVKCCAVLGNRDNTGCREVFRYKKRQIFGLFKRTDGGDKGGGNGGRGGRK